ncbi:MAG: Superoxide dismutase [Chloroflexi bacterium AL-W]|nr:Superoxide dismutase [Chloroflexi bacterium AL-N1]NOK65061.1 Superoxide dismutase [Chloroflexi bacterium AL-N10]NOK72672.1 Superoxide dismutase [Chloroflexi bacterium AL-N5]NOK79240.1 Superoxide dismutase [Chloroflexi bacterium AL-W]NOK87156.1 Superoxide dismutase [Chloroflexi bacterium AL-N15]
MYNAQRLSIKVHSQTSSAAAQVQLMGSTSKGYTLMEQCRVSSLWNAMKSTSHRTNRRRFLGALGAGSLVAAFIPWKTTFAQVQAGAINAASTEPIDGVFALPPLPYNYAALEPHIDTLTMSIHHGAHHHSYVRNLNTALAGYPDVQGRSVVDLLYHINDIPEAIRTTVRHNGGGHLNHSIFWATMGPGGGGQPVGTLATAINATFGSFESFQQQLSDAASRQFGSGWGWLVLDGNGNLAIVARPNQDSPVMDGLAPLVGVDVWEHAYYLKYQNKRGDYLSAWWNTINWEAVALRYDQARNF